MFNTKLIYDPIILQMNRIIYYGPIKSDIKKQKKNFYFVLIGKKIIKSMVINPLLYIYPLFYKPYIIKILIYC